MNNIYEGLGMYNFEDRLDTPIAGLSLTRTDGVAINETRGDNTVTTNTIDISGTSPMIAFIDEPNYIRSNLQDSIRTASEQLMIESSEVIEVADRIHREMCVLGMSRGTPSFTQNIQAPEYIPGVDEENTTITVTSIPMITFQQFSTDETWGPKIMSVQQFIAVYEHVLQDSGITHYNRLYMNDAVNNEETPPWATREEYVGENLIMSQSEFIERFGNQSLSDVAGLGFNVKIVSKKTSKIEEKVLDWREW